MDALACPKCGFLREPQALDCPACGVVFAKLKGKTADSSPPALPSAFSRPATADLNPYAPPQADLAPGLPAPTAPSLAEGLWRSNDVLVMQKQAVLPDRCLSCNRPTSYRWSKTFYWSSPWLRLLMPWLLIWAIVTVAVRKKADLAVPLCPEHDEKRRRSTTLSWLLLAAGLVLFCGSFALIDSNEGLFGVLLLLGVLVMVISALVSSNASPVQPKKIDDYYVWLKKVSPELLRTLPQVPSGM